MMTGPTATPPRHQLMPPEEVPDGTRRWPRHVRVPLPQPVQDLARPPVRMPLALRQQLGLEGRGHPMRTRAWCTAPVLEPRPPLIGEAVQPLIAIGPGNPVADAQLRHRVQPALVVIDELGTLGHRIGLLPRH